jgi:UDP-glucose:(heptosyl)LPS alpha-1,3-glucosyltransferase
MRICLTTIDLSRRGGIARCVAEVAERLAREHDVHIITPKPECEIPNAIVHRTSILWRPISLQVASNALANIGPINALRREGVEVVNSQGAEAVNSDIVTMHSCQKSAVRKMRGERGAAWALLKALEPRNNVVLAIERRNMGGGKRIIAISKTVKDEIIRDYGVPEERISVIYNGVNLEEFNPGNREICRLPVRARHGLKEEDTVLMFSGWEFKRKGLRYAIEALPKLGGDVKLLVVGGADRGPYEGLAARLGVLPRVIFAGAQSNMAEYYGASDAFVFPTAYEPFGLVITEAMAAGLPVVTTKVAGAAELITDGTDGMLLDSPYDGAEVAEKAKAIFDGGIQAKMGAAARKTAEKYSWDSAAEQTLRVYREFIR